MGKKKTTRERKKKEKKPVEIQLIPIAHFDGRLTPDSALSWLRDELPGYQRLIGIGLGRRKGASLHEGAGNLAYGVERMTEACVEVISTKKAISIIPDSDRESWSSLGVLSSILEGRDSWDNPPNEAELDAIARLVDGGLDEIADAHQKTRAIREVLDGPVPSDWSLFGLARDLASSLGKDGVLSLLCDFDSLELRAFIRACHQKETETRGDVERIMFGASESAEARA
jgi:hypothetical protein